MKSRFYVGQEVVCIEDHADKMVNKGLHYIITGVFEGCNHYPEIVTVGISGHGCACPDCLKIFNMPNEEFRFNAKLFAPIEEIPESHIREVEKLLEQLIPIEVQNYIEEEIMNRFMKC